MLGPRWKETDQEPWVKLYRWVIRVHNYKYPDYKFERRGKDEKKRRPGGTKAAKEARAALNNGQGPVQALAAESQHRAPHAVAQEPAEQNDAGHAVNIGPAPVVNQAQVPVYNQGFINPDLVHSPAQQLAYNQQPAYNQAFVHDQASVYNPVPSQYMAPIQFPADNLAPDYSLPVTHNQGPAQAPTAEYQYPARQLVGRNQDPTLAGNPTPGDVHNMAPGNSAQAANLEPGPVVNPTPAPLHNEPINFDFLNDDFDYMMDRDAFNHSPPPVNDGEPSPGIQPTPIAEDQHSVANIPAAQEAFEDKGYEFTSRMKQYTERVDQLGF